MQRPLPKLEYFGFSSNTDQIFTFKLYLAIFLLISFFSHLAHLSIGNKGLKEIFRTNSLDSYKEYGLWINIANIEGMDKKDAIDRIGLLY